MRRIQLPKDPKALETLIETQEDIYKSATHRMGRFIGGRELNETDKTTLRIEMASLKAYLGFHELLAEKRGGKEAENAPKARLFLGIGHRILGNHREALGYLEQATKGTIGFPLRVVAYSNMAKSHSALGERKKAEEALLQAVRLSTKLNAPGITERVRRLHERLLGAPKKPRRHAK
jgi:tetratricopeptide (TPR) repeat protein